MAKFTYCFAYSMRPFAGLLFLLLAGATSWATVDESFALRDNGAIPVWLVAGLAGNGPAIQPDLLAAERGEAAISPAETSAPGTAPAPAAANTSIWQSAFSEPHGGLNFGEILHASPKSQIAYAFCQLEVAEATDVLLAVRHNDAGRVWLNGKLIHDWANRGGPDPRESRVTARLQKGRNRLLAKVNRTAGDWSFGATVLDAKGAPAKGVAASVALAQPLKGHVHSVRARTSPLVAKSAGGNRSLLLVDIYCGGLSKGALQVSSAEGELAARELGDLGLGRSHVELEVPFFDKPLRLTFRVNGAGEQKVFENVSVPPAKPWTIYLTQHTHTDIGYTRPQTEILPEHLRYIDYALDYCDLTDAYPEDARFRWTCETGWAVREYLNRRPPQQVERLKKRLQEGRIEIAAMLLNMAEVATESSLAASLQTLRTWHDQFGVTPRTAMQNDVNGAAWCLVDYFSDAGVKYLSMGINKTRSLLPFDMPTAFWWESPSGKRLLAYRSDHYMTANFWQINQGKLDAFKPGVANYLLGLEDRAYPFERVGVQFSGYYTDNSPPSTVGCDVVQKWNETYAWPKLRLSTAHEFLEFVEKNHSAQLQVFRAGWPDWWTDGFGSAARETGAARETEAAMQVNQGVLAMASILGATIKPSVAQHVGAIQDDLLFYAEHTYGAAESISDPLAENSQIQWGEKSSYAWSAVKNAALLREEAFGLVQDFLPRADVPTLAIFNTLGWERSGLVRVFIDHEILPKDKAFQIIDPQTGEAVAVQEMANRAEGTYWALWVKDVPPLGYKMLRVVVKAAARESQPVSPNTLTLENRFYSLTLDERKGALRSLKDKETRQELIDQDASWGLGQCLYETLAGGREMIPEAFKRTSVHNVKVQPGANGAIWQSWLVSADLDGCATNQGVKMEIRLYQPEKRVEFHFEIRKLPVIDSEAVYVAFPFSFPNGKVVYEAQGGALEPGVNQIPGSASDWQTIQSYLAVRSSTGQVLFGCDQAPLVQLGGLNLGKWQPITQISRPHVYSWVMNNYWFTNFRASQEGAFKWSYSLSSTKETSNSTATRFGWGSRIPLASRVYPPGKLKASALKTCVSALTITKPNLLLVEARPAVAGEGILLHLRELNGEATTLTADDVTAWGEIQKADEVNVLEETLNEGIVSLDFRPFEVKFLRLRIAASQP